MAQKTFTDAQRENEEAIHGLRGGFGNSGRCHESSSPTRLIFSPYETRFTATPRVLKNHPERDDFA